MKEGEKVYVITEYQIEEDPEENFYQPRCLVGFKSNEHRCSNITEFFYV